MNRQIAAFYVTATQIGSDGIAVVPLTAALPRIDPDDLAVQPGDDVFVVDENDDMSSAVVVKLTASSAVVRVGHDWFRMSLADVEMRAYASAVEAIRRGTAAS